MIGLRRLAPYVRFAAGLARHVRAPVDPGHARAEVARRLANREAALAELIERHVYDTAGSPYRALLDAAGWSKSAVLAKIGTLGVEAALGELAASGVHVTLEEFKGRQPAVRGSRTFAFAESDFDNRRLPYHVEVRSGGTRSAGTRVPVTLEFASALADDTAVLFDEWRLWDHAQAIWLPMGGAAFVALLIYARLGRSPARWFSHVHGRELDALQRWAPLLVSGLARAAGRRLPRTEHVPATASVDVARWMAATARAGRPACVTTYASSAVRLATAAVEHGLDLGGAAFITIGEPLTAGKRRVIERSGARVIVRYAMTEAGIIGYACGTPRGSDDLHALESNLAIVQQDVTLGEDEATVGALLFTSLLPVAPKILLNVQSGDYADVERRDCGCTLGRLGYTLHLANVRSFEKLTGEGVTFATTNLLQVLEDVLPSRFGGSPTDYQVVEEETEAGLPRLLLVVNPAIGRVDEIAVRDAFLGHLETTSGSKQWGLLWKQAGTIEVRRAVPTSTKKGKVQPFHLDVGRSGHGSPRLP